MTDIEFAEEVAVKVWKYVRSWDEQDQRYMWFSEEDSFEDRNIIEEVKSWEGFGLTVEAMDKRGWLIRLVQDDYVEFIKGGHAGRGISDKFSRDGYDLLDAKDPEVEYDYSVQTIIMATHHAALDAVKENG